MCNLRYFSILLLLCVAACAPEPVQLNHYDNVALSYADSLSRFTMRYSGTESIIAAKDYICGNMRSTADTVVVQSHDVRLSDTANVTLYNIVCKFYPAYQERVLLYTNYDQDPDNGDTLDCASAAALLMSVSQYIADNDPGIGVDIVFFDGRHAYLQDTTVNGYLRYCLGSQSWAEFNKDNVSAYQYGISVINPAHKDAFFVIDGNSNHFASRHFYFARSTASIFGAEKLFPEVIALPYYGDNTIVSTISGVRSFCLAGQTLKNGNVEEIKNDNIKYIDNQRFDIIAKIILETLYTSH